MKIQKINNGNGASFGVRYVRYDLNNLTSEVTNAVNEAQPEMKKIGDIWSNCTDIDFIAGEKGKLGVVSYIENLPNFGFIQGAVKTKDDVVKLVKDSINTTLYKNGKNSIK